MIKVNGRVFVKKVRVFKNIFRQGLGLMFSRKLGKNEGVLFDFGSEVKMNLHTWFVFYSIDMIFIGGDFRVVQVIKKVKPFTPLIIPKKRYKYLLEVVNSGCVKVGDKISITFK